MTVLVIVRLEFESRSWRCECEVLTIILAQTPLCGGTLLLMMVDLLMVLRAQPELVKDGSNNGFTITVKTPYEQKAASSKPSVT